LRSEGEAMTPEIPPEISIIASAVLVAYLGICLSIGYLGFKKTKAELEDYFLARRTIGYIAVTMSFLATCFSAWAFLGHPGQAYTSGVFGAWWGPAWWIWSGLLVWLFAKRIWKLGKERGYITLMDYFYDRYGSMLPSIVAAILSIVFLVPYVVPQIMGFGYLLNLITGLPYLYCIIIPAIIAIIYVTLGGIRSVVWTDVVQGGIQFFGWTLAMAIIFFAVGGWATFHKAAIETPELFEWPGPVGLVTPQFWLSMACLCMMWTLVNPHTWRVWFAAKSLRTLKFMFCVYTIVQYYVAVPAILVGIPGRVMIPGLSKLEADKIFPLMLLKYAPAWLWIIMFTAGVAAAMNTMDTQMLAASSMATRDLVQRLKPVISPKILVLTARILVVVLALISLYFAWIRPAMISLIGAMAMAGFSLMLPSIIGGFLWRRGTKWGVTLSLICGVIVLFYTHYIHKIYGFHGVVWGLLTATIVYIVVSLLTKPPPKEVISRFVEKK